MAKLKISTVGATFLLALMTSVSAQAPNDLPEQPVDVDIIAGETLYADNCAACHGDKLEGQPNWRINKEDGSLPAPPHDESGHTWHHGDALLFEIIKTGGKASLEKRGITDFKSGMPAFGDSLSDQEIWDLLAYMKSTWPKKIQELQLTRTEAEKLYGN